MKDYIITHRNNAVKVADLKRSRILKEASKHYKQDEKRQDTTKANRSTVRSNGDTNIV